jgi:hypothetical protein
MWRESERVRRPGGIKVLGEIGIYLVVASLASGDAK